MPNGLFKKEFKMTRNTKRGKQKMTDEDTEERHFTKGGKALLTQTEKLDPQLPVTTGKILNS